MIILPRQARDQHSRQNSKTRSCSQVSCGEYLWDHRNGSMLTQWFTEEYVGGSDYGLGNDSVDGCEPPAAAAH